MLDSQRGGQWWAFVIPTNNISNSLVILKPSMVPNIQWLKQSVLTTPVLRHIWGLALGYVPKLDSIAIHDSKCYPVLF